MNLTRNPLQMITNTGYDELKDVMAYLAEVPFDVARKSLYHPM